VFSIFSKINLRCFVALSLLVCIALLPSIAMTPVRASSSSWSAKTSITQKSAALASYKQEVLVRFKSGVSENDKNVTAANYRVHRNKRLRGDSAIEKLDLLNNDDAATVAAQLGLNPQVEFAEPNFAISKDQTDITPSDPRFSEQWAIKNTGQGGGQFGSDINAIGAWGRTTGAQSTIVAVIDSGIDFTHPDLINNEWTNPNPTNDDVHGWDYIADTAEVKDVYGHGTAVAGIIAAQGNNGAGVSGVMWRSSLMSLRVLDNSGSGDVGSAVEAIDYAVTHGAQVINLSWGTTANSMALKDAIQRAVRRNVVVVCSAGNDGQDISQAPYYPASFNLRGLISVAGTDNYDRLAAWSNWGPVTVAAPGVDILTTQIGGGYRNVSGTSAAAPLVSGIVGLIKSGDPSINPDKITKSLTDTTRQVASLNGKTLSGGVVNAADAVGQSPSAPGSGNNPNKPSPVPTPDYGNNGRGQGPSNGISESNPQDDSRRANGKDGKRVEASKGLSKAPLANLPDLNRSRKTRKSPTTSAPSAPIHANMMCSDCDPGGGGGAGGNDAYFGTAREHLINETGKPGVTLASRNFNWGVPIVSLSGRAGLDLSISLYYNSLVWTKQGSAIQYNADHGSPAPGFQIGLPRLQDQFIDSDAGVYAYMMVTPSGGRVVMRYNASTGTYESADSGYTQLTFSGATPIVRTSDGTQYVFGTHVNGEYRCTTIEDRNGNYISATYDGSNGHILTITDTLGRVLNFGYDGDGNLYNITQTWGGTTHAYATFIYTSQYMSFNFSGLTAYNATNGGYQTVLSYVALSDNTSYHFDYNSYGQVYQIRHKAPDGHELEHTWYNIDTSSAQTDCPRFSDSRYYAQDWNNNQEAITYFSINNSASWTNPETGVGQSGSSIQQTSPDGTSYIEYSHSSGWDAGLTQLAEWWSGGARKKWSSTSWTQDNPGLSYMQNPRVAETNIYDDSGNRNRTTVEYNSGYGLPTAVREYSGASGQTFQRLTTYDYHLESDYVNRRVIGLPFQRLVYDGPTGALVSKVQFYFDWDSGGDMFQDTPAAATQHDRTNYGPSFLTGRGNLSDIIQYDVNDPNNSYGTTHETKIRVNTTGSVTMKRDANWHPIYFDYADSFSDGVNRNTFAYPTTATDADGNSATTRYNYDFGAVTLTHSPTSGTGGSITYLDVTTSYDNYARIEQITNQTNQTTNSYKRFVYETNDNYVHTYETIIDPSQANEFHTWQIRDGAGRVRATASDHPGSAGGYMGAYVVYDNMGRVWQQSNPTEFSSQTGWYAAGDDATAGWLVTQQTYDWKGRPLQTTNTDGTTKVLSYGGCGCAGGEVSTMQDEHGRQKRATTDALGRLATIDEINWNGTVYSTTNYTYNARDQVTGINQAGQTRSFDYDGYGRLWHRTTPEQGQTTYTYNVDDTVNLVTDARGATTTYGYNGRHQMTSLSYAASGGATSTANAYFSYDAAGNRTWMQDGQGYASYAYNALGQMTSEGRYFNGLGSWYYLNYAYNAGGELTSITNPWNAQVGYGYDKAGRVTNTSGSGYAGISNYANNITYRAFGSVKGVSYGDNRSLSTDYDSRLRPKKWDVSSVLGYNYNYDYFNEHTGRVSYAGSIYDPTLDRSYEYDQVGRLVVSHSGAEARAAAWTGQWGTMDGPYSQGYVYDPWGNLTQRYGWGGEVQGGSAGQTSYINYSYTNNRRNGFTYDAAGNLTNDLGQNFTYDVTGQQTSASYGGYSLSQYYDGDGLRVVATENGATTYYIRSTVLDGEIIAEMNGSGSWQRGYVYDGSSLLAVQQGGVFWVHEDPVTKSKRVTDSAGNVVSTVELDPWAADTNRSSNSAFQPKRFTSYSRDGNQSDEAMFRRFNRWHSRFDQPDPTDDSYDLGNPQTLNRYAYVQNDPVNSVDPSGAMCQLVGWMDTDLGRFYSWNCTRDSDPFGGYGGKMGGGGPQKPAPHPTPTPTPNPAQAPQSQGMDCRVRAMLDAIAWAEGNPGYGTLAYGKIVSAPGHPELVGQRGAPGNPINISDLSHHPNIAIRFRRGRGGITHAAGRYQFMPGEWNRIQSEYGQFPDFGAESQDSAAVDAMKDKGMIDPLMNGDVASAAWRGRREWASLPGSPYHQRTRKMNDFIKTYNDALSKCKTGH